MLALRPNCECCDKDLPPEATDAMICSYECTFCTDCVNNILNNVCPNCGGNFCPRPIRPLQEHRKGTSRIHSPASSKRINTKLSKQQITAFSELIKNIPANQR